MGFPCGRPALAGRDYGLTLFLSSDTNGLDLAYAPAVIMSACPKQLMGAPTAYRFGSGLTAAWAC